MSGFLINKGYIHKRRFQKFLVFSSLVIIFLLSDFYYSGIGRPFDYVSLIILAIFVLTTSIKRYLRVLLQHSFIFVTVSLLGLIAGIYNGYYLASFAIFIGIAFVFPASYILIQNNRLAFERAIYFAIKISLILFFIQLFFYHLAGYYIDFTGALNSISSRGLNESLAYFRPHGIFQEPNGYCTATFSLLSLCLFFSERRKSIENIACLSLFLSLSLWGIAAALLFLVMSNFSLNRKGLGFLLLFIGFIFIIFYIFNLNLILADSITFNRILNIGDDASFEQRIGGDKIFNTDIEFNFLFGYGVNTDDFQSTYGANGVSFLVYSFGLVGLSLLFFLLSRALNFSVKAILANALILATYPIFSYMYFWCMFGALVFMCKNKTYN